MGRTWHPENLQKGTRYQFDYREGDVLCQVSGRYQRLEVIHGRLTVCLIHCHLPVSAGDCVYLPVALVDACRPASLT